MRLIRSFIVLCIIASSPAYASAQYPGSNTTEEIVITLEDLDQYTEAMLRIYALSNEITLRVATKREDLMELHSEFNHRVMAVLDRWDLTIPRYNEIERASQLIPSIRDAIGERVRVADSRLKELAQTPKTLEDAQRLLRGRVDYPINASTLPWLAEEADLESMIKNKLSNGGMPGPSKGMGLPPF